MSWTIDGNASTKSRTASTSGEIRMKTKTIVRATIPSTTTVADTLRPRLSLR
jgi:hypothetical protein